MKRTGLRKKVEKRIVERGEEKGFPAIKKLIEKRPLLRELIKRLLNPEVLLPKAFYDKIVRDVINAKKDEEIVIYSPFTHKVRVYDIASNLKRSKGKIVVYTQHPDRFSGNQRKWHEDSLKLLKDIGATIYTRERMHEKAVIIGDRIAYFGSLNVLSRLAEEEAGDYMLRYDSPLVTPLINEFMGEIGKEETG